VQGHFVLNRRPSQFYELQAVQDPSFIELPGGNVVIHVASLNGIISFTPDIQFAMQAQYDTSARTSRSSALPLRIPSGNRELHRSAKQRRSRSRNS
jgi:hypothetical protein